MCFTVGEERMQISVSRWCKNILGSPERVAVPIMTNPGIGFTTGCPPPENIYAFFDALDELNAVTHTL